MSDNDSIIEYVGLHGQPAKARIRYFDNVILLRSNGPGLESYKGLSVTNGLEKILAALFSQGRRDFGIVIEHYFGRRTGPWLGLESFTRVSFAGWKMRQVNAGPKVFAPYSPTWEALSRTDVEDLIGGTLDD